MRRTGILADQWFQNIPSCASSDLIGIRQLIESNACSIQNNSQSIQQLVEQSQRTDAKLENLSIKLERLSDIVLGNYRNIVRVETGTTNNEGVWLDTMECINALERRVDAIEERNSSDS